MDGKVSSCGFRIVPRPRTSYMDHLVSLGALAVFDASARRWLTPLHKVEHTRWCAVHAASNAVVAATALPSLVIVSRDPWTSLTAHATRLPITMAMWLHAYHALLYSMSTDDRMHHLVFVLLLGTPSYVYAHPITNMMLFFLSGVPGGLIYALVALRRCGIARSWDEPRFSARVNLLLRAPGVLWGTTCLLLATTRPCDVPTPVLAMQLVLPVCNAVYYARQSLERVRRRE